MRAKPIRPLSDSERALVLEHLPLAVTSASHVYAQLPIRIDVRDLVQVGVLGLIDAATHFDSSRNTSFGTYARGRVRGAILDYLRSVDWLSRDMRHRLKQIEKTSEDLQFELKRNPSESEIAQKMGMALESWHAFSFNLCPGADLSLTEPVEEGDEPEFTRDTLGDRGLWTAYLIHKREALEQIGSALSGLPLKWRLVVRLYYSGDLTMLEIGKRLGVNESRVSQIHKSAIKRLKKTFKERGISSIRAFEIAA